jgi:hypothetical protein
MLQQSPAPPAGALLPAPEHRPPPAASPDGVPAPTLRPRRGSPASRRAALACLVAVWLAFVAPMFTGEVHFPVSFNSYYYPSSAQRPVSNSADSDGYGAYYPWHVYLGDQLRAGHLPLWDTTVMGGAPYAADASMAAFYPPNWLYAFGHPLGVVTLIWAVTLLASLLATYWLFCVLRLHPLAAALGAIVWTFGGFMMSYALLDSYISSAVWLPMALGGMALALYGRPRRGVPIAGAALALSILGGHAQITVYVWVTVAIFAGVLILAAALQARGAGRGAVAAALWRGAATAGGVFAVGVGLAAVQVTGALPYERLIVRQKETFAAATGLRLTAAQLPTLLLPHYLGNPTAGTYPQTAYAYAETTFYVSVLALPLAVAGLFHRRRRLALAFALVVATGAIAAFGTPLFHLLYALVPGVARTRSVTRFKLLIDFGLAALAALGLDALLGGSVAARRAAVGSAGALAAIVAVLGFTRAGTTLPAAAVAPDALRALAALAVGALVFVQLGRSRGVRGALAVGVIVLVGTDLWAYGAPFHPFERPGPVYPTTPLVRYLESVPGPRPRYLETYAPERAFPLPPDASMVYPRLYSLNGYTPFIPAAMTGLIALVQPQVEAAAYGDTLILAGYGTAEPPIFDLLGVDTVLAAPGVAVPGTPVPGAAPAYREAGAFPPAFVAPCWQPAGAGIPAVLGTMNDAELRSTALVAPGAARAALPASPAACRAGPAAAVERYQSQDVVLSVPASSPGGVLVLTDAWFPGWAATVDGAPAPVLKVDGALRGVALAPGAHTIEFTYRPAWPLQGLVVTLLTAVVVLAWVLRPRRGFLPALAGGAPGPGPAVVPLPPRPAARAPAARRARAAAARWARAPAAPPARPAAAAAGAPFAPAEVRPAAAARARPTPRRRTGPVPETAEAARWVGVAARLSLIAAVMAAGVFVLSLLAHLNTFVVGIFWNSDVASIPVIGAELAHRGGGFAGISMATYYSSFFFELLTRHVPFHRTLWQGFSLGTSLLGVGLLVWSARRVSTRQAAVLTAVLAVAASPLVFSSYATLRGPTWFNGALLGAFLVALACAPAGAGRLLRLALTAVVGILTGINLASDPLLLVSGLAPLLAAAGAAWLLVRDRAAARLAGYAAAAAVVAGICWSLTDAAGHALGFRIEPTTPVRLVGWARIVSNLHLLGGDLWAFGNAEYPHRPDPLFSVAGIVTVLLAFLAVWGLAGALRRRPPAAPEPESTAGGARHRLALAAYGAFWLATGIAVAGAFLVTNLPAGGVATARYLIPISFATAAGAGLWAAHAGWRRLVAAATATVFALLSVAGFSQLVHQLRVYPPTHDAPAVIAFLEQEGLTKGYASYWDSLGLTWRSNLAVDAYPVVECGTPAAPALCKVSVNTISSWYRPVAGVRTFLVAGSPALPLSLTAAPPASFGQPVLVRHIDYYTVYVYDHDVAAQIGGRW